MTFSNRLLHIFLVFCALLSTSLAQAKVTFSGTVTDDNNQPVEFATVRIDGTALGTITSEKGTYSITAAEADTMMVIFTCIGYSDVRRRVIHPQGNVSRNVKMYKKSTSLSELEVKEYKKQISSMQTIDASVAKLTPDASGGSVESVLTTMAGVSSKNELSTQYMVRGGSYDENIVYINGLEVYRPQLISSGQQEGLSVINPDMVQQIGFSTGGYGAQYGDKMSSVLDITYRQPAAFEEALALSLQGGSLSIGSGSKKFTQLHGVRFKRNTSLLSSLDSKGEYDPQYFDYQTNMTLNCSPKFDISLLGNITLNNYRFTPKSRQTSFGTSTIAKQFLIYFDGYEKDKFYTYFGALSLNFRPSKKQTLTLTASAYRADELVSYDVHGEYWLDEAGGETPGGTIVGGEQGIGKYHEHSRDRLRTTVVDVALKGLSLLGKNKLSYGVDVKHESIYENANEWQWRDSAGYSLPHEPEQVQVIYNLSSYHKFSSLRFSAFVADALQLQSSAGLWILNAGVRASYWIFIKELSVSPRASIGFVPARNERWSFRFATGLYYQAPNFREYRKEVYDEQGNAYIELNKNIRSQRAIHFILGSDYSFRALNRPFKLSAEIYYKALSNLIPYEIDNLKLVYSGENSSAGHVAGIDLKFFGQFVPGTDSWISVSFMNTSENLYGVKVPRPTDQRYSFALFFTDYFPKFPKLKFSLKGVFSDGLPTTAPHMTRAQAWFRQPAYKRVDIGLSYQLLGEYNRPKSGFFSHFKNIWLGVDVFNIFDISNVSSYYWVTDVNTIQYAVPNYLTRRQINARLSIDF